MSPLPSAFENGPEFQFSSLTSLDRQEIVILSADFNFQGAAYIPYKRFDMSALGADVDLDGFWDVRNYGLAEWRHVATAGRDHYVRIVQRGYLYPLGHRAVIVHVVERNVLQDPANPGRWSDGVLQQQVFIKVTQPVVNYPQFGQPFDGNSWPFTRVEMKTLITPPLATGQSPGVITPPAAHPTEDAQLIYVQNGATAAEVQWIWVATDLSGKEVHLSSPLFFLYGEDDVRGYLDEYNPGAWSPNSTPPSGITAYVAPQYNLIDPSFRTVTANGAHIKYSPEGDGKVGSTTHPTTSFVLGAGSAILDPTTPTVPGSPPSDQALFTNQQPSFYPAIMTALVRLPAAEGLSRGDFNDSTNNGIGIQYYPDYVTNGLVNSGQVYMELVDAAGPSPKGAPTLKFPGDAVGGIATPNINVTGLSSTAGTVSGPLDTYASAGSQSPSAYFPGLTGPSAPQLFGGLTLGQILQSFTNEFGLPTIVNELDHATGVRTVHYTMTAALQNYQGIFVPNDPNGTMTLTATITIAPNGSSSYIVVGTIDPFVVNIMSASSSLYFLQIPFNKAKFTSQSGKKPDIKVEVGQIQFEGALQFVNTLEQFLEDLGGSGFQVNVLPTEIKAGFSISLPDISIGIVDLSGLAMSASVEVPFLGAPALATFSFASKEHQFLVTVSMFGGGGYITLVLGLHAVQQVTASVEFAGSFGLDLYVASGSITLTAGIYYEYDATTGVQLTGFVKLVGTIQVLGIISVTVELDLTLTYQALPSGQNYVSGTATLSLSIHVIFFTISIPITIHKQFSGSGTAPPAAPAIERYIPVQGKAGAVEERPALGALPDNNPQGPPTVIPTTTFATLVTEAGTWATYCSAFAG
jgi:hypothetical protein